MTYEHTALENDSILSCLLEHSASSRGEYIMVLFRGYFDESYSDESPRLMAIAGYVLEKDAALSMDELWRRKLADEELSMFHMTDCANGFGEFDGMSFDRRDQIARHFIGLVRGYVSAGFAFISNQSQFDESSIDKHGSPYAHGVKFCIGSLNAWVSCHGSASKVSLVLESGHADQGLADRMAFSPQNRNSVDRVVTRSFADKREAPLLQAADILAWQSMKNLRDHINKSRPFRKDYLALTDKKHNIIYCALSPNEMNLMFSDPGLNERRGEERRKREVMEFMDLLSDETTPADIADFVRKRS
tara:strand:- start:667 stop:1575 length:909 start_codon:yes stop_codon:yes gene_type:complete